MAARARRGRSQAPALRFYAVIELLIGISAIVVPYELSWGRRILESLALSSSFGYYCVAGLWVAWTLIPWCALMGATIPVAMRAIGQTLPREAARSFSYLYMANVTGAVAGTILPLLLIELLGFRGTLMVGTLCNALIALAALMLSSRAPKVETAESAAAKAIGCECGAGRLADHSSVPDWPDQHGDGSGLGAAVHALSGDSGLRIRVDPCGVSSATFVGSRVYRWWSCGRVGGESAAVDTAGALGVISSGYVEPERRLA